MTKLCPRGKAAAKRKFKVYPSAYANAYASKICAGKIKDPSGTKRKDWGPKKANEGTYVEAPKLPRRPKGKGPFRPSTEYLKKKKAYDTLVGNDKKRRMRDPRMRPGAKKGALMIIIGVGKKKKVDKKMGGGMTAGSMSGMGRLQKARMMNKGGRSLITRGGGADSGIIGKLRDIGARGGFKPIPTTPKVGFKPIGPEKSERLKKLLDRKSKKEKISSAVKKAVSVASPVTGALSAGKKLINKFKSRNKDGTTKPSGSSGLNQRGKQNKKSVKKIPVMEAKTGGMAEYYKDLM